MTPIYIGAIISQPFYTRALLEIWFFLDKFWFWSTKKGWEFMPPMYIGAVISQPFCNRALLEIGFCAQINPDFWPTKGLGIYAPYVYRGYNFPTLLHPSPALNQYIARRLIQNLVTKKGWVVMPPIYIGAVISQPFWISNLLKIRVLFILRLARKNSVAYPWGPNHIFLHICWTRVNISINYNHT